MAPDKLHSMLKKLSPKDLNSKLEKDQEAQKKALHTRHLVWFHRNTNRGLAETKLRNAKTGTGTFLVRENVASPEGFVVSFITKPTGVEHFHIGLFREGYYGFTDVEDKFHGLDNFIDHYRKSADGLSTVLTKPCPGGDAPPLLYLHLGYSNLLHRAIESVKVTEDEVKKIFDCAACPDLDSKSNEGSTALHLCCTRGFQEVASALIKKGASINVGDAECLTPLHLACRHGHAGIVRLLLSNGADPQYRQRGSENVALHEAASQGHLSCVKELLEFNVPAWPRNQEKQTPDDLTQKHGHDACSKMLNDHKPPESNVFRRDWLHESINRQGAVSLLEKYRLADGHFLVRKNSKDPENFVLTCSFNNKVYNHIIKTKPLYYIEAGPLHNSLEHLIQHYCMYMDGLQGRLTHALSPEGSVKRLELSEGAGVVVRPIQRPRLSFDTPDTLPRLKPPKSDNPTSLDPKSIELEYEIGQGEFGSVMKGTWTSPEGPVPVAIKTLNPQYLESGRENFMREALIMVKFDHPCIVKLIGVCEAEYLMLVQELVDMGALLDYLLDYPEKIRRTDLYQWASQIACGMSYLEKEGFVHRDLATRNILLGTRTQAKVGDFGLSRAVTSESDYYRASKGGRWPVKWYAPESVNYGKFTSASDVWSYGVTMWEMWSYGDQPYGIKTGAEVIQFLENNGRLEQPDKCPNEVYELMLRCWQYKPQDRPTFEELYKIFSNSQEYMNVKPKV